MTIIVFLHFTAVIRERNGNNATEMKHFIEKSHSSAASSTHTTSAMRYSDVFGCLKINSRMLHKMANEG